MQKNTQHCRMKSRNHFTVKISKSKNNHFLQNHQKQLRKQLTQKINQQICDLPTIRAQFATKSRRLTVPPLYIQSVHKKVARTNTSQKNIVQTNLKVETDRANIGINQNQSRASFKVRKVTLGPLVKRNNFSSISSPKRERQASQYKQIHRYKTNFLQHKLAQTNVSQRGASKKQKEQKLLIAATKRLPFSLDRRSTKRKLTQKTNATNTIEDLFDLDISMIIDHNEGPDTPFIRRGSFRNLQILPNFVEMF